MTDFFSSLDRALEPERDYWAPEPVENPDQCWPPVGEGWQTIGWTDEAIEFRDQDLLDLQERINAAIIRRDANLITFRISPTARRDYDYAMFGSERWSQIRAEVEEAPEPVGYDGYGAPLYAHQIPSEGTE